MKLFSRLFVWCFLLSAPLLGLASDLNAYHIFCQDDLWGIGDTLDLGYATTYTPDFDNNVPLNSELDEVYLHITFNPGVTPSIGLLSNIRYGNEHRFAPGGDAIKYSVSGQNLYIWYGFQDRLTSPIITTDSRWSFEVSGSDPVASVDFFVSYHSRTSGSMPDLERGDFQNLSVLSFAQIPAIQQESPSASMSAGGDFGLVSSGKKIIVLVHGWNPDGNVNHYADPASWQNLETNLLLCPVVAAKGWVVTRYDWAIDAMTGPETDTDAANASRDAAAAHGRKLGKALAAKTPSQVLFIAHSAGNWAAKRAAAHLKSKFPAIKIQITSLDPFVNDGDGSTVVDDMDLTPNFEMMSQWTDYRDNYYVYDSWNSDIFGWTSGNFAGWNNQQLEAGGGVPLYDDWMLYHKGPIAWYGRTVGALRHINEHKELFNFDIGYVYSLPIRGASPNDDCGDADQLTGITGDRTWFNYRATSEANEPWWHDGVSIHDPVHTVWGSWTPSASGIATFRCEGSDMGNAAGTACVNPSMAVFSGTPFTDLTRLATNPPSQASLSFPVTAGTRYYIVADGPYESGSGNAVGKIPLHWSMDSAPAASVAITAPASRSTVSNTVAVAATASGATKVEFYLDGVLQSSDYAAPFAWSWNTLAAANRDHALVAKSYDGSQLIDSSPSVLVTVNNAIAPPPVVVPDDYEPNNTSLTAYGPIPSGTTLTARVDSPTDADWFKVTISEPGVVHLALTVPAGNDYDLELFSPTGTWLAGSYNKAGMNESLDYPSTTVGTYTFRVYGYPVGSGSFNTITPYSLAYAFTAGSNPAYILSATAVHGSVIRSSSMDAYPSGSTVTVTANPSPGYQFSGWSGDLGGTTNPASLIMTSNMFITANFSASTSTVGSLTVTIQPPEAVAAGAQWKLTTESGWHNSGSTVSGLVFGSYTVQYNAPAGWYPPANREVGISVTSPNVMISGSFIQQSVDPLDIWTWRNPLPQGNHIYGVTFGNGQFVAVGDYGTILTSSDGIAWTVRRSSTNTVINGVTYGNGQYVAVGIYGTILTSSDGIVWSNRSSGTTQKLNGVTYGNGQYMAVGLGGTILTSPDGITWTSRSSGTLYSFFTVTYGNGLFVAGGENVFTSPDGITWTYRDSFLASQRGATYGGGQFVMVGGYNPNHGTDYVETSSDGITWKIQYKSEHADLDGVAYGGGQYVAVGPDGYILTSPDGIVWSKRSSGTTDALRGVTYGNGQYVAVGIYGTILTSSDGIVWSNRSSVTTKTLIGVTYGNGKYVAVGSSGVILTSPAGVEWAARNSGTNASMNSVTYGNGQYVAVGSSGVILTSPDGVEWAARNSGTNASMNSVTYGNGQYVAVGSSGVILTSADGVFWTARSSGTTRTLEDVIYGNGQYVVTMYTGAILTSPDGVSWTTRSLGADGCYISDVTYGNGQFAAVGSYGVLLTSSDGGTWIRRSSGTSDFLTDVTYGNGQFVVAGFGGLLLQSGNFMQPGSMKLPEILVQPANQSASQFANVSFSVMGEGVKPLSYIWLMNGEPIPGQVNSSLVLNNVNVGQAGEYSVLVSNAYGVVASDVATLTVLLPPTIVAPPQNRTVLLGGTATFSVVVNGDAPFSYQWRHNDVDIPGANDDMLRLTDVQSSNTGTYSVVVSSGGGSVESASAALTLWVPPLTITPSTLPVGMELVSYNATLQATNGNPPYAWSVAQGIVEGSQSNSFVATGTAQGWHADDDCWMIVLPFGFPFFGATHTNMYINSNGTIMFDGVLTDYSPDINTLKSRQMISALWADLSTYAPDDIRVEAGSDAVTVYWDGHYLGGGKINVSVTLSRDGTVVIRYGSGNANGGMIGVSAGDGQNYLLSAKSQSGSMDSAVDIIFTPVGRLPDGLSCDTTGLLSGMPTLAGTSVVTFVVQDSVGVSATKPMEIVIAPNPNMRPVISSNAPSAGDFSLAEGGSSQLFQLWAYDPEGSNLTYSWTWDGVPVGGNSSSYMHTTAWGNAGLHELRCIVSDGFWTNVVFSQWAVTLVDNPTEITGTVTGPDEVTPLENTYVTAYRWNGMWWDWFSSAYTDAGGHYEFVGLAAGTYRVMFVDQSGSCVSEVYDNVPGTDYYSGVDIVVSEGTTKSNINASLSLASTISGTVTGPDGVTPLENTYVTAYRWNGWMWYWFSSAYTDANGQYAAGGLAAGTYRVTFSDQSGNCVSEVYDDVPGTEYYNSGTDILVPANSTISNINASLSLASTITGTVTGPNGVSPLTGISVQACVWNGIYWFWKGGCDTDSEGNYAIGGLAPGTYRIQFNDWSGNYVGEVYANAVDMNSGMDIVVPAASTVSNINASLDVYASLGGSVVKTGGSVPVPNVTVRITGLSTGVIRSLTTDADGRFLFSSLRPDNYAARVDMSPDGEYLAQWYNGVPYFPGQMLPPLAATLITLGSGALVTNVNFTMLPAGHISGNVTGAGFLPVASAMVWVRGLSYGQVYSGQTDGLGNYRVSGLLPDSYKIKVGAPAFQDEWWNKVNKAALASPVAVASGDNLVYNFDLASGQSPALVEVTSDPAGATVYLDYQITTNVTPAILDIGEVDDSVWAASHVITVKKDGRPWPSPRPVAATEAETVSVHFDLTSSESGSLDVSTEPEGTEVYVDYADTSVGVSPVVVGNLAPGSHVVLLRRNGHLQPRPLLSSVSGGATNLISVSLMSTSSPDRVIADVRSVPPGVSVYVDYLPSTNVTDVVVDWMDPASRAGTGWGSASHVIMLRRAGYAPTLPRYATTLTNQPVIMAVNLHQDFSALTYTNGGGLPDQWLASYDLLNRAPGKCGAHDDADGDGMSNEQEMLAGTNPFDPNSSLAIVQVPQILNQGGSIRFVFDTVPGRTYVIQGTDDLMGGWSNLSGAVLASDDQTTYTAVLSNGVHSAFYRIVVLGQ